MRRLLSILFWLTIVLPLTYAVTVTYSHTNINSLPELESGDLIFQTAITPQMPAIFMATGSLYTHVGVVRILADKTTVIQAARNVVETPLEDFIHAGWGERITIRRYKNLTDEQRSAIVQNALAFLGRPYNYEFYFESPNTVYCSQIPYLAYKQKGLSLGKIQKIGELFVNNPAVKQLFSQRWQFHPACQNMNTTYESCWQTVMKDSIITPVSIERDPNLATIYTNYLF